MEKGGRGEVGVWGEPEKERKNERKNGKGGGSGHHEEEEEIIAPTIATCHPCPHIQTVGVLGAIQRSRFVALPHYNPSNFSVPKWEHGSATHLAVHFFPQIHSAKEEEEEEAISSTHHFLFYYYLLFVCPQSSVLRTRRGILFPFILHNCSSFYILIF